MLILNSENQTFDLNHIGKVLNDPVYYGVFDYSDKSNGDYFFRPLVMTELFDSGAIQFQIGKYQIMLPQKWSIVLGDPETGDVELILLDEINLRKFHALVHNPIEGIMHKFMPITPTDAFPDVGWSLPRLSFHNFLLVPLAPGPNPDCIFIINESDQKKIPQLDLNLFI